MMRCASEEADNDCAGSSGRIATLTDDLTSELCLLQLLLISGDGGEGEGEGETGERARKV